MPRRATLWILLLTALGAHGQEARLSAELLVESDQVYVGEQFPVQIRVEGSSRPREPDLAEVRGFEIRYLGGAVSTSEFLSMVNGKVSRTTTEGYVFSYYFSASTAGTLVIPAITVVSEGRSVTTEPRRVVVTRPAEGGDFHLAVEPAKGRVYVGEGFVVNVVWYIATPVRSATFVVPFLQDPGFRFRAREMDTSPNGKYAKATVNDQEVVVVLGEGVVDGRAYTTVTWTTVATPIRAGSFEVPASSVHFEARVERQRQRSLVESFFDTSASGDYRPFVVSSSPSRVRVVDLPAAGRPAGFAGHVGRYGIRAEATPREATVGDPITLTLVLSGPPNVADAAPPDLTRQPISRLFELSPAPPQGLPVTTGTRTPEKPWVFTIRSHRAGVTEIPPVELPYFDPYTGEYDVVRSPAVPLRIVAARVVTSRDAEGTIPAEGAANTAVAAPADGVPVGLYDDGGILRRQHRGLGNLVGRPLVLLVLLVSILGVAASAALTRFRPLLTRLAAGGTDAWRRCERELREIAAGGSPASLLSGALASLLRYLGARTALPPETATSAQILARLADTGVPPEPLTELSDVVRICEAGRYAGYPLSRQIAIEAIERGRIAAQAVETYLRAHPHRPRPTALLLALALGLASAHGAQALDVRAAREILAQATELYATAARTTPAGGAEARELYARSALLLEQLVAWRESGGLYYDLGRAYDGAGDPGRAILSWRRAELLTPGDPNLRASLEPAVTRIAAGRGIAPPEGARPPLLPADLRSHLASLLVLCSGTLVSVWLFRRRGRLLHAALAALACALLLVGSLAVSELAPLAKRMGVITATEIVAHKGDGAVFQAALDGPLTSGTEFRLRNERSGWYEIELSDGRTGWIPARAAELVIPRR